MFELPEGDYIVDDIVFFISIYEDGFRAGDKLPNVIFSYKINGIKSPQYQLPFFSPTLFAAKDNEFKEFFPEYIQYEILMGKHGFYVEYTDDHYLHIRYIIEGVDGDILAQFQLEGRPGGNSSNCSCLMQCYSKRYCPFLYSLLPICTQLVKSDMNYAIPVITLSSSNISLTSLFTTLSMVLKYKSNGTALITNHLSSSLSNDQIQELSYMETMIKKVGYDSCFFWIPVFLNEEYNTAYCERIILNTLATISRAKLSSINKSLQKQNTNNLYLISDNSSINDDTNINIICKNLISIDGLKVSPCNNLRQLDNISIPNGHRDIIDGFHLIANFATDIFSLPIKLKNTDYKEFYYNICQFCFNDEDVGKEVENALKSLLLPSNIEETVCKRIEDIRKMNSNVPNWFTMKIFSSLSKDDISSLHYPENSTTFAQMKSHDKIICLLSLFEILFIDFINHPIIFTIIQIIRCFSYAYCFNDGSFDDIHKCHDRLQFYSKIFMSILPYDMIKPTFHRISHFCMYVLSSGFLKFHDNFRMEREIGTTQKIESNYNNEPVKSINNKLYLRFVTSVSNADRDKDQSISYEDEITDDNAMNILQTLDIASIALCSYIEDLLFEENDNCLIKTLLDNIPSFSYLNQYNEELQNLVAEKLQIINQNREYYSIKCDLLLFSSIHLRTKKNNEIIYFVAKRSTNLEKYANLPSISENIPDDIKNLSQQIAFTLDNQQDIQCYLVSGFLSCEINGNTYPLAVCYPLERYPVTNQKSRHFIILKKTINFDRITLISINRLHFGECMITPGPYQLTFGVAILSIYVGQYNYHFMIDQLCNIDSSKEIEYEQILKDIEELNEKLRKLNERKREIENDCDNKKGRY